MDELFALLASRIVDLEDKLAELNRQPGPAGADGAQGEQGPAGLDGAVGPRGEQGPAGAAGERGPKGDKGDPGPKGDKGDAPAHEWDGTKLRFQNPDGTWGEAIDLKGKPGKDGKEGMPGSGGPRGLRGLQGPEGPQGPPGSSTGGGSGNDLSYEHSQIAASADWVVVHNLGKHPSVTIIDSAGDQVMGEVHYDSINQLTVSFSAIFSGKAYLN